MKFNEKKFTAWVVGIATLAIIAANSLEQRDRGTDQIDSYYIRWSTGTTARPAVANHFSTTASADTATYIVGIFGDSTQGRDTTGVFKIGAYQTMQIITEDTAASPTDSCELDLILYTAAYPTFRRNKVPAWSLWSAVDTFSVSGVKDTLGEPRIWKWDIEDAGIPVHQLGFIVAKGDTGNKLVNPIKLAILASSRDMK